MKKINSLSDLLMEELADLLSAENQLVEALTKMAQDSESSALKDALERYLAITREHADRLKDIFGNIGQKPSDRICKAIQGFITESRDAVNKAQRSSARDAVIINAAQRMEQYEITGYKKAREHAADLGHTKIVELFTNILNDQRAMNFHLNELAQGMINAQTMEPAVKPQGGGFYVPEGKFSRKVIRKGKKNTEISRFISEGNPNADDQNLQNPEVEGDES